MINMGEERLSIREWPKVGGATKKQIKKDFLNFLVNISKLFKCTITEKEGFSLFDSRENHTPEYSEHPIWYLLVQSEQSKQQSNE